MIGNRVQHSEYGEGIVTALVSDGFCRVFFSSGERTVPDGDQCYKITAAKAERETLYLTTDRARSLEDENLDLLGLDYPPLVELLNRYRNLSLSEIGVCVCSPDTQGGVLSLWYITVQGKGGNVHSHLIPIAVDPSGKRLPTWERQFEVFFGSKPSSLRLDNTTMLLKEHIEPTLQRELLHRGLVDKSHSYDTTLVGWVEAVQE